MTDKVLRISASAYSNTAPLVWSFLFGENKGRVELIMDNAPARSVELLSTNRVDAALVPVIASQYIEGVKMIPDVCVGTHSCVQSVCLVTKGIDLVDVRSISLDTSSRTSAVLTKIIFREFLGFEPKWVNSTPNIEQMLDNTDAALLIGDPALSIQPIDDNETPYRKFDLAELWNQHTGFGFIFAMWMTRRDQISVDFSSARDEGLEHVNEIIANYQEKIGIGREKMVEYFKKNILYQPDAAMLDGMKFYFQLAANHGLIDKTSPPEFLDI